MIGVTRGLEAAAKFGMTALSVEEQGAATDWLENLQVLAFDDTTALRTNIEEFYVDQ